MDAKPEKSQTEMHRVPVLLVLQLLLRSLALSLCRSACLCLNSGPTLKATLFDITLSLLVDATPLTHIGRMVCSRTKACPGARG